MPLPAGPPTRPRSASSPSACCTPGPRTEHEPDDLLDFAVPVEQSTAAGYGEGLYTPEWTARTYAALLDRASALLSSGESVVLDAAWSDAAQREAAPRMSERTGADLVALHCHVPGDVSAARLSTRAPGACDADLGIAATMAAREQPWPEAVAVDTSGTWESAVAQALAAVRPWGTGQAPVFRRPCMEPHQGNFGPTGVADPGVGRRHGSSGEGHSLVV